jgi:hypothetical protein
MDRVAAAALKKRHGVADTILPLISILFSSPHGTPSSTLPESRRPPLTLPSTQGHFVRTQRSRTIGDDIISNAASVRRRYGTH